jgi:hypothetical protein
MNLISWILVGAIAGWLAGQVVKGRGMGLLGNIIVRTWARGFCHRLQSDFAPGSLRRVRGTAADPQTLQEIETTRAAQ